MPNIIAFPSLYECTERAPSDAAEIATLDGHFMTQALVGMRDLLADMTAELEVRLAELNRALDEKASHLKNWPDSVPPDHGARSG